MRNARTDRAVLAVEVDGRAPGGLVPVREVVGGELGQVVAVGAEVVVDHVEQHGQAQAMGLVDQPAEVVGPAVASRRGEQVHAVVAPAAAAREVGHGQQLDGRDAQLGKLRQPAGHALEGPLRREGADVQLVDDQVGAA